MPMPPRMAPGAEQSVTLAIVGALTMAAESQACEAAAISPRMCGRNGRERRMRVARNCAMPRARRAGMPARDETQGHET
jgi:hypothetical protein